MRNFIVNLTCDVPKTFLTIKAAQSLDIDIEKKSQHIKKISADVDTKFNVGVIFGSSGSGKTTLARQIYNNKFSENNLIDLSKPIIEQFPKDWTYEQIQKSLSAIGLTQVPCWIKPAYTLSNGQRFRAETALKCAYSEDDKEIIIDEWTSVVDRTVAKVMSHSIQKFARRFNKKIVLISCHYDVIEWLQPDWIIDCNKDIYQDRRSLRQVRSEKLKIDIREIDKSSWKYFGKYHYLSENLPGGKLYFFGAFIGEEQIGFNCFANYVMGKKNILHSNRTVIHPDYCGLGIGFEFDSECCEIMKNRGYKIMGKFSSIPTYNRMIRDKRWRMRNSGYKTELSNSELINQSRKSSLRNNVRWWSFEYIGKNDV